MCGCYNWRGLGSHHRHLVPRGCGAAERAPRLAKIESAEQSHRSAYTITPNDAR